MTTAYTSLLGLALPVDGELTGTWGQVVNNYITTYLDGAVAGTQIISGSGSQTAVTLSKTTGTALIQVGSGTTGSSQYQVIKCSGAPASLLTVTVPSAEKTYLVINATSTSQSVKIVGASGTGVTIASGKTSIVAWNGSDFVEISPSTATTATTATAANGINSATTTVVLNSATAPTTGQVLTATSGTAATWQTPSASGVTSVTATSPVASTGGTTPVISMTAASTSVSGYLTNTDWNTFNGKLSTSGGTMTGNLTLDAYTEKVATLATSGTIALNPSTGTTLSCAAAGTVTFTDSLSSGQSISLLLTNGSTYTINWPTTTWVTAAGNTAPTLSASNTLVFWKISSTLYGALVGKSA